MKIILRSKEKATIIGLSDDVVVSIHPDEIIIDMRVADPIEEEFILTKKISEIASAIPDKISDKKSASFGAISSKTFPCESDFAKDTKDTIIAALSDIPGNKLIDPAFDDVKRMASAQTKNASFESSKRDISQTCITDAVSDLKVLIESYFRTVSAFGLDVISLSMKEINADSFQIIATIVFYY
jgi:hypothetical protein